MKSEPEPECPICHKPIKEKDKIEHLGKTVHFYCMNLMEEPTLGKESPK